MKTMMKSVVLSVSLAMVGASTSVFAGSNTVNPPPLNSHSYHLDMDLSNHDGSVVTFTFTPGKYVDNFNGGVPVVEVDPDMMQTGLNVTGSSKLPADPMQFGFKVTDGGATTCQGTVSVNSVDAPNDPNQVSVNFSSGSSQCSADDAHPGYLWFQVD